MGSSRLLAVLAAIVCTALVACTPSAATAQDSLTSPVRPTSELGTPGPGQPELPELGELPGLDDLELLDPGELRLPDLSEVGGCLDLMVAYAQLLPMALVGAGSAQRIDETVAELEAVLPERLLADLDMVADTLRDAQQSGLMGATEALGDEQFLRSYEAVASWLVGDCVSSEGS